MAVDLHLLGLLPFLCDCCHLHVLRELIPELLLLCGGVLRELISELLLLGCVSLCRLLFCCGVLGR